MPYNPYRENPTTIIYEQAFGKSRKEKLPKLRPAGREGNETGQKYTVYSL